MRRIPTTLLPIRTVRVLVYAVRDIMYGRTGKKKKKTRKITLLLQSPFVYYGERRMSHLGYTAAARREASETPTGGTITPPLTNLSRFEYYNVRAADKKNPESCLFLLLLLLSSYPFVDFFFLFGVKSREKRSLPHPLHKKKKKK